MPLPDDASLHIPYEVEQVGEKFVAVQKKDDDIIYASPIDWTTRDEAVLHCEDLNYLRMKAVDSMMTTTLWVAIDVASDGPDGVVILERILHGQVAGWRLLNPAADDDHEAWLKHRDMVRSAVDALSAQDELPEDSETLLDHLRDRHGHIIDGITEEDIPSWVTRHREKLHGPNRPESALDHTHEWTDEEVEDDGPADDADSEAEAEGAHEDDGRG